MNIEEIVEHVEDLKGRLWDFQVENNMLKEQLKESRLNDSIAMSWIADMKTAAGIDAGVDMPGSVKAMREMKQQVDYFREKSRGHFDAVIGAIEELKAMQDQRDELLTALKVLDRGCRDPHCIGVLHGIDLARAAIAKAEETK